MVIQKQFCVAQNRLNGSIISSGVAILVLLVKFYMEDRGEVERIIEHNNLKLEYIGVIDNFLLIKSQIYIRRFKYL